MYRLRQMDIDDKVCEQVSMTLLAVCSPASVAAMRWSDW
jgi:hypothetical protein